VAPFFVADVITIAVLIAAPQIILWLPGKMGFM
jgi:TRAP-type C4-dicarboxylate transport system permease large subunit